MTAHDDTPSGVETDTPDDVVRAAKNALRREILAARAALPDPVRARRAAAIDRAVADLAADVDGPVCAYLPVGTEPGSPAMLDTLVANGHEVLLPVVTGNDSPLEWAHYTGVAATTAAALGTREPHGRRLGPEAISRAGLVLVPGLAADRSGIRMGRGRGHYDRTLALAAADVPLVILLNDEELLPRIPAEPHDRPVTAALLPEAGLVPLGTDLDLLGLE